MSGMKGLTAMVAPVTGSPLASVSLTVHSFKLRAGGAGVALTKVTLTVPPVAVWLRPTA